jgi:hypothetical protein
MGLGFRENDYLGFRIRGLGYWFRLRLAAPNEGPSKG